MEKSRIADLIKYLMIYVLCFVLTIFFKYMYIVDLFDQHNNIYINNIITTCLFAFIIFFFSFAFNNTSVVDMGWGSLGVLLLMENVINKNISLFDYFKNEILKIPINELVIIICGGSIILVYSLRHIFLYLRYFKGLSTENEDFRYKEFQSKYGHNKIIYWTVSFFLLHQIPMIILNLAYQPVFTIIYSIINRDKNIYGYNSIYYAMIGYASGIFALIVETIADEQLALFREEKEKLRNKEGTVGSRVIYIGLWKYLRHPNYFGEVLYFFSLLFFVLGMRWEIIRINFIGFFAMASIFIFYSVPAMENYLLNRYKEEYVRYRQKVKNRLIPLLY